MLERFRKYSTRPFRILTVTTSFLLLIDSLSYNPATETGLGNAQLMTRARVGISADLSGLSLLLAVPCRDIPVNPLRIAEGLRFEGNGFARKSQRLFMFSDLPFIGINSHNEKPGIDTSRCSLPRI